MDLPANLRNFYSAFSMATPPQPEDTGHTRILGTKETMKRLGCSRSSLHRLEKKGILHKAKEPEFCSTAGFLEDQVDALVESRRPDRQEKVQKANAGAVNRSGGRAAGKTLAPAPRIQQAIAIDGEGPDLVPTTMRIMGKVVYLHRQSGRLLMEIGKLTAPGQGLRLTPSAIAGIEADEDD